MIIILEVGGLKQEGCKFQVSLGYFVKFCFIFIKRSKKKKEKEKKIENKKIKFLKSLYELNVLRRFLFYLNFRVQKIQLLLSKMEMIF